MMAFGQVDRALGRIRALPFTPQGDNTIVHAFMLLNQDLILTWRFGIVAQASFHAVVHFRKYSTCYTTCVIAAVGEDLANPNSRVRPVTHSTLYLASYSTNQVFTKVSGILA